MERDRAIELLEAFRAPYGYAKRMSERPESVDPRDAAQALSAMADTFDGMRGSVTPVAAEAATACSAASDAIRALGGSGDTAQIRTLGEHLTGETCRIAESVVRNGATASPDVEALAERMRALGAEAILRYGTDQFAFENERVPAL